MAKKAKYTVRRFDATRDFACCYGQQGSSSQAKVVDPYAGLGRRSAYSAYNQFANPLLNFFTGGPSFNNPEGKKAQRYDERMQAFENSPLGQYAAQYKDFFPQMIQQATNAGSQIASQAPGIFDMIRQQVASGLQALPGLQQAAGNQVSTAQNALGQAGNAVNQAFSPIANQALYQNAMKGLLDTTNQSAAARGLLDAGSTQNRQEQLGTDLASQFAQNQFAQQQAALQGQQQALGGVQSALGTQAGLLPLGAQLAGMSGDALSQLASALQTGYGMPADALSQVFSQLAAFANPTMQVGSLAAPTVTTTNRSTGFNIL